MQVLLSRLDNLVFALAWPYPILTILAFMLVLAVISVKAGSLTLSGAFAAVVEGSVITWSLGTEGLCLFLFFFVCCNLAGRFSRSRKAGDGFSAKGSTRDLMQVLANGLMASLAALMWMSSGKARTVVMFASAVAQSMSDTFAGEIGRLSAQMPRSILTRQIVPRGMSGGVTPLGTLSGLLASLVLSFFWLLLFPSFSILEMTIVWLCGFAGCMADSFLGACFQAIYRDPDTGELTEREEKNGKPLELVRGIRLMDNDMVNLMSSVFSSVLALGMCTILKS